jgi:hypothetical protein
VLNLFPWLHLLVGLVVTFSSTIFSVQAQPLTSSQHQQMASATEASPFLSAGVQATLLLPNGMYGQWQVQASLLEATDPELFPAVVNDIWLLERLGNTVRLTNPATKASATIFVETVQGNSAAFYHVSTAPGTEIKENPHLTLVQDTLVGYTLIDRNWLTRSGALKKASSAHYKLVAQRLGTAPAQVSQAASSSNALQQNAEEESLPTGPTIEISPIQQEKL